MVSYVRQKITIELIYPLTDCCHIHTQMICQFIGSVNMKGKCVETVLLISHMNRYFRLTWLSPKLVTQPAIVHRP